MFNVFPQLTCLLSDTDCDFITTALAVNESTRDSLRAVLTDPEAVDIILDDTDLHTAQIARLPEGHAPSQLAFYLLVRPALRRVGLDDRGVTRFLAALLAHYAYAERQPELLPPEIAKPEYMQHLTEALKNKHPEQRFLALTTLGNYALLASGLFPERLHGGADVLEALDFCDRLGSACYRAAAVQPLAGEFGVTEVYTRLGEDFRKARLALQVLAEHDIFRVTPLEATCLKPELFPDVSRES